MKTREHRRCPHCLQAFVPDYRNAYHQRFCSKPECQYASKRSSQRRWLRNPKNRNYFREPDNVARVQEWRQKHPRYWSISHHRCTRGLRMEPAQILAPASGATSTPLSAGTLQEVCRSKLPILTGIVSRLECCTLQEDIARCAEQMVFEAQCILLQCQSSFSPPAQTGGAVNYHDTG